MKIDSESREIKGAYHEPNEKTKNLTRERFNCKNARETKRLSKQKKRLCNDDKSKRVKNTQEWASTISFQLFSPRNSIHYTDNFIKFYLFCRSFVDKLTNKININVNFGWCFFGFGVQCDFVVLFMNRFWAVAKIFWLLVMIMAIFAHLIHKAVPAN